MRLRKVNQRILQLRNDGWFWDSRITPELARYILCLKDEEEAEFGTVNGSINVVREGKKFFIDSEEDDEQFGTLYSSFVLWQNDLEKIAGSLKRKPVKETFHTAVNSPLHRKFRSSIRTFKRGVRRAKWRSCYLEGFTEIKGVTSNSAEKFFLQRGFRISPEGELFHPRARRSTAEKVSSYKTNNWLRGFGL